MKVLRWRGSYFACPGCQVPIREPCTPACGFTRGMTRVQSMKQQTALDRETKRVIR